MSKTRHSNILSHNNTMKAACLGLALCIIINCASALTTLNSTTLSNLTNVPVVNGTRPGQPIAPPSYMVDNTQNRHGAAPDRYAAQLEMPVSFGSLNHSSLPIAPRQSSSYWLANMQHGQVSFSRHLQWAISKHRRPVEWLY